MKTRPRLSTTATALALATLLILGTAAGGDGFVVCTDDDPAEPDGRSCGCCSESVSPGESGRSDQAPEPSACSDCVDVPISVPSFESRTPVLSDPNTTILATTVATESVLGHNPGSAIATTRSDQHWRSLAPLSTVVLLT